MSNYYERRPGNCTEACKGSKVPLDLVLHINCGGDGSISHKRCSHCKGLVLVATGNMALRERKYLKSSTNADQKTTRILPDPDVTPLHDLVVWLKAYARKLELASRKELSVSQALLLVAVRYALDEATAGSKQAYEREIRAAMTRIREVLIEEDEAMGVA